MGFIHQRRPSSIAGNIGFALDDILSTFHQLRLVTVFGWQDIRQRYRRSVLGPFWITVSMAVMIAALGIVFGAVLKSPMESYLPFLTIGLIMWTFMSTVVTEGCTAFTSVEGMIRQMPIPFFVYVLRMYWRNTIILGHNLLIYPFVCLILGKSISLTALWAIPGFAVVSLNLLWIAVCCAVFCTRFRDVTQIIGSLVQVAFYISPIIWMPAALPARAANMILEPNPIYHMLAVIRDPILGVTPVMLNWTVTIGMACVGWLFALWLLGRARHRIAYWL